MVSTPANNLDDMVDVHYHVLVVEDDPDRRAQIASWLQASQHTALLAKNVEEAETHYQTTVPDLLLIGELGGAGYALCERLSARRGWLTIPVIMLINTDDDATLERVYGAGAADYITYPVRPLVLRQRIRTALGKQQSEKRLHSNQQRSRTIAQLASDYAYELRVEPDGSLVRAWVTGEFYEITGYDPESDDSPDMWRNLIHPEDMGIAEERYQTLMRGDPHMAVFRIITKSGQVRWIDDHAHSITDDDGRVRHIYGVGRDVTAVKRTEQDLRHSRETLQLAVSAAELGVWDWNIVTGEVYYSPGWLAALGYDDGELEPHYNTWFQRIHPDDVDAVQAALTAHFEGGEPYRIEHRLKAKDGTYLWHMARGKVIERDDEKRPLRMVGVQRNIHDAKVMQQNTERNEERLKLAMDATDDGLWDWDVAQGEVYYSPSWMRMLGYEPDEVEAITPEFWLERVHPDDIEEARTIFQRHLAGEIPSAQMTFRIRKKDNTWIWVQARGRVMQRGPDGQPLRMLGTQKDITRLKETEEALRESEERHRIISETISDYAYSYIVQDDGSLKKHWSTAAFHEITGYTFEEMDSDGWLRLIHPDDLGIAGERSQRLLRGEVDVTEFRVVTKDGETRWLRDHGHPVMRDGRVTHIYGAAQDITQSKGYEEQLREQAEELRLRNEELDAFAYTVAHDLKNPISSMMGFASLVRNYNDRMSDEKRLEYVNLILESGYKLKEIINALLMLAGVTKSQEAEITELDMKIIVDDVVRRMEPLIDEAGATITMPDDWPSACGYGPWVEEVWTNYISNAIKYGGDPPAIELGSDVRDGGDVNFWVRDNGRGLTEDEQKRVFTPFTRLNQVRTEGHGLGLSIVQRIVEKLGGTVRVESEVNRGSTFCFSLPARPAE